MYLYDVRLCVCPSPVGYVLYVLGQTRRLLSDAVVFSVFP